jgi:hypothetical protein
MFRHTVEAQDAVVAVILMEASLTNSPLFEFKNPLHSMFPENPDEECIFFLPLPFFCFLLTAIRPLCFPISNLFQF